jgi:decaprenyl-phosphate phosphoribosyltransferase
MTRARALLVSLRPRQWVKNLLVVAGPLASGLLLAPGVLPRTVLAVVAFCLLSASGYLVNDVLDAERDRHHPLKKDRPLASGDLTPGIALTAAAALVVVGLGLCALAGWGVLVCGGVYVAAGLSYSLGWKQVPVLDLLLVASAFALRGLAGVFAVPTRPTVWFVLLTVFGSLMLVAGKRSSEKARVGDAVASREILAHYSDSYLQFVREFCAAGLLMAYGLMAFDRAQSVGGAAVLFLQLSILPFLALVLVLVKRLDEGKGETPEDLLLRDGVVQAVGAAWVVVFVLGVYL